MLLPLNHKQPSGMTLIEIILYIFLLSTLLFAMIIISGMTFDVQTKQRSTSEVIQQGIMITDILTRSIENASAVDSPTMGNSDVELSLDMIDNILDPTIFSIDDNILYISEGSGGNETTNPLHNDMIVISDFTVENRKLSADARDFIHFSFTLSRVSESTLKPYTYSMDFFGSATVSR